MNYLIFKNKNLVQIASKESFYNQLESVIQDKVSFSKETFNKAMNASKEILQSGRTLKISTYKFKMTLIKKPLSETRA